MGAAKHIKITNQLWVLGMLIWAIVGCKKVGSGPMPQGNYSGKFSWFENGIVYIHGQQQATLSFNNGKYSALLTSTLPNANSTPDSSDGNYVISGDTAVIFSPNINGSMPQTGQPSRQYQFHYEKDSLILTSSYRTFASYQYRLKRN